MGADRTHPWAETTNAQVRVCGGGHCKRKAEVLPPAQVSGACCALQSMLIFPCGSTTLSSQHPNNRAEWYKRLKPLCRMPSVFCTGWLPTSGPLNAKHSLTFFVFCFPFLTDLCITILLCARASI